MNLWQQVKLFYWDKPCEKYYIYLSTDPEKSANENYNFIKESVCD